MAAAGAEERERLAAEKARLEREAAEARAKAEGGADTSTGGLHVAVTTAAAARDQLKAIFAQHVPGAKLAAASKLEEDLRRATEKDAANPLLGSTPKSFSSSFKSPLPERDPWHELLRVAELGGRPRPPPRGLRA